MTVNKERVLKLVQALESGEFIQGRGRLHYREDDRSRYCCLGVACMVAIQGGGIAVPPWEIDPAEESYTNGSLSIPVMDWYGFDYTNPSLLIDSIDGDGYVKVNATDANDTIKLDFKEIAAAFRRTYLDEQQ